jgi:putative flippase GtrA
MRVAPGRARVARQFTLFALIGAVGTAGHYAILIFLVRHFGVDPVAASVAGFVAGALINYSLNYKLTFRSRAQHVRTLTKFLAVAVLGAILNMAVVWLGIEVAQLHYLVAQAIATGAILVLNFALSYLWAFRGPDDSPAESLPSRGEHRQDEHDRNRHHRDTESSFEARCERQ